MNSIKRWAKLYYNVSPLFRQLSNRPEKQELFTLNPRIFAAYLAKQHQERPMTISVLHQKITKYFQNTNSYCFLYLEDLILMNNKQNTLVKYENELELTFHSLLIKFYNRCISYNEFKQLAESFGLLLEKDLVTDFEHYIIDISFHQFQQCIIMSRIGKEAGLHCFGDSSKQYLEEYMNSKPLFHIFSYISLVIRLKTIFFSPQTGNKKNKPPNSQSNVLTIYNLFNPNINITQYLQSSKHKIQLIKRHAYRYILWLLYTRQYGTFLRKFVNSNYLYQEYSKHSLSILSQFIQNYEFIPQTFSQLVLINEIMHKIQDIQLKQRLSTDMKMNMLLQSKVKKIRIEIKRIFQERCLKFDVESIQDLQSNDLLLQSYYSINYIKTQIQGVIHQEYYHLIYGPENISKLLNLCMRIEQKRLYQQIKKTKSSQIVTNQAFLVHFLQNILYNNIPLSCNEQQNTKLSINNLFELKRIHFCLNKIKDFNLLKRYFSYKEISLLQMLKEKLNKPRKQMQKQPISTELMIFFSQFYY